jgi:hypothetical protein
MGRLNVGLLLALLGPVSLKLQGRSIAEGKRSSLKIPNATLFVRGVAVLCFAEVLVPGHEGWRPIRDEARIMPPRGLG